MWLFTADRAYHLERDGHCYDVYHGTRHVGRVCEMACCLEWREPLWGNQFARSPRVAAKYLLAHS